MRETLSETMQRVKESADLRSWCESNLEANGKTFTCPFCGSGTGPRRTSAFSVHGGKFKCFSCGESGDVYDLAAHVHGIDNTDAGGKREVVNRVAEWAGVEGCPGNGDKAESVQVKSVQDLARPSVVTKKKQPEKDYTEGRERAASYVEECARRLTVTGDDDLEDATWASGAESVGEYLESRGISAALAARSKFGYDPAYAKTGEPRLIVPWPRCTWYYTARSLRPGDEPKYKKLPNDLVGGQPPVSRDDVIGENIIVVEGLFDYWCMTYAGTPRTDWNWSVVPLGGVGNGDKVARAIADQRPDALVTLMLDNDEAGLKAARKMADLLTDAGVDNVMWPWGEDDHDPADSWRDDPVGLRGKFVSWTNGGAREAYETDVMEKAEKTLSKSITNPLDVLESIYTMAGAAYPVPTGINALDDILGGGLQPGSLHVIAASSSAGKTTLTLQIADRVAQSGRPVLFVTCEQRPEELVAKSVARISSAITGATKCPVEATEIRNRVEREHWPVERYKLLVDAGNSYAKHIAPNMRYLHTRERVSVEQISSTADLMKVTTGQAPVVFIDYLQLLSAPEGFNDVRLAIDENMTQLRDLASRLKVPVWVVSSVGRAAYYGTVDMGSFKESSGIEFSCDVALGLQPYGMADDVESKKTEAQMKAAGKSAESSMREQTVRRVELTVLKNRYGRVRPKHGIPLVYRANVDRFDVMEERTR